MFVYFTSSIPTDCMHSIILFFINLNLFHFIHCSFFIINFCLFHLLIFFSSISIKSILSMTPQSSMFVYFISLIAIPPSIFVYLISSTRILSTVCLYHSIQFLFFRQFSSISFHPSPHQFILSIRVIFPSFLFSFSFFLLLIIFFFLLFFFYFISSVTLLFINVSLSFHPFTHPPFT